MQLTERQIAILKRLASGKHSFDRGFWSMSADPLQRLSDFQGVVSDLDRLHQEGLISVPRKHEEKQMGQDWVVQVMVDRITDRGSQVLSA